MGEPTLDDGRVRQRPSRAAPARLAVLSGRTGSGKTTLAGEIIELLRDRGVQVGGILAPGLLTGSRRSGFDLVNLATGRRVALCREGEALARGGERWARFVFSPDGLEFGRAALVADGAHADVVVVDEVGPLELAGGGWAEALDTLVGRAGAVILVVAREAVVEAVRARWGSPSSQVWNVPGADTVTVADGLEALLDAPARATESG